MHAGPEPEKIKSMFSEIASGYDRANSVLSVGIHTLWKKRLIEWSGAQVGDRVLDCATGTGDLAFLFKEKVGPGGMVQGIDFCQPMLKEAREKALKNELRVEFTECDAMNLKHLADSSFDICSIAFGIRNVENPSVAIKEMRRILAPGGVLMILEFGQPRLPIFKNLYQFYSQKILPKLGGFLTNGNTQAYEYLNQSSEKFPCREDFAKLVKNAADFKVVEIESLSGGIAYLYKAIV